MVVIGSVSPPPNVVGDEHEIKMLTNSYAPLQVSSDADGQNLADRWHRQRIRGSHGLYYTRIYSLTPTVATVTGTITYR